MKKIAVLIMLSMLMLCVLACSPSSSEFTALFSGNELVFSSENGSDSLYTVSLSHKLKLFNTEFESISLTVYSDNGGSVTLSATKGETAEAKSVGGSLAAATVIKNGESRSFALSPAGLDALLASDASEITVPADIAIDGDLIISRPVSVYVSGSLSAENIYYFTDSTGKLLLSGNISCGLFAASAPLSSVEINDDLVPENSDLYICAASVNGGKMNGKRTVSSVSELEMLCERPDFYRPDADTLLLEGFSFEKDFTIGFPCRLDLSNVSPAGHLSVVTDESGDIALLGEFVHTDIDISAPTCGLTMEYPCSLDEATLLYDIMSLNGNSPVVLGGESKDKIISAVMYHEGKMLTENIRWKASGNELVATVSGVVAPSELENAQLTFRTKNGGTVEYLEASLGNEGGLNLTGATGAYVLLTDAEGKTSYYKIVTEIESQLPVVIIETENDEKIESRFEYINATVEIQSDFSVLPSCEKSNIQIKGRGNSTWSWSSKLPYKMKFQTDVSLLGLNVGKEWVLLANYADKSLIRNYVALEAAKVLDNMECYATQYPVDVFVSGEYVGVYTLGEQIEVGDDRVPLITDATDVDTGFFMEIGGKSDTDGKNIFSISYMESIEIIEPSAVTEKQKTYITNFMKIAEEAVHDKEHYEDYINVDSIIDWFIMTEVSFNSDGAMRRSVFMKKDHGENLEFGPVWDYDLAFGNSTADRDNYQAWCCLATEYGYVHENWMCRLMEDESFVEKLKARWNEIKDPLRDAMLSAVDRGEEAVSHSAEANFEKWDILGDHIAMQPSSALEYDTYEELVQFLRDFINARFDWIDKELNQEN